MCLIRDFRACEKTTGVLLVAVLMAIACGTPTVHDTFEARTGLIRGTIVYPGGTARGNVIVLLFDERRLPPPTGSSGPVNFVVVPRRDMFGEAPEGTRGDFSARFTIPTVAAGRYQIRAFVDSDGDFNPLYALLGQATAGDIGGGLVDPATGAFLSLTVETDKVTEHDVLVSIGRVFPVERPAFAHTSTTVFGVPFATPAALTLSAHAIMRPAVQMDPKRTAFLIQRIDENGDGQPDDANGDHLPDVYPRVILRRLVGPEDACQPAAGCSDIVPLITNPLPFADELNQQGFALTTTLELIVPPVSVRIDANGRTISSSIPEGSYETVVISGTGQTWQVPNDLDVIQPNGSDPTQSVRVKFVRGQPLAGGSIAGTLSVTAGVEGDAYVFAFDVKNPPPPQGSGSPVAFATIPKGALIHTASALSASFVLRGLREGSYIVTGLVDADASFSPLVSLLAQPSAGDVTASKPAVVEVAKDTEVSGVTIELDRRYPYDRPAFSFEPITLSQRAPTVFELQAHAIDALGFDDVRFPVTISGADADADNLPDVYPRVVLTKIADGERDVAIAANDPSGTFLLGIVDPLPFLAGLAGGAPYESADRLRVIVPPVAFSFAPDGRLVSSRPVPAGLYRVNVLTGFGQTWSVPGDLDVVLNRVGTPLEDSTQTRAVRVPDTGLAGGVVTGNVSLAGVAAPSRDFTVVVLAFDVRDPPPPVGFGRPVASVLVSKAEFGGGSVATYTMVALPTGTYQVRAFLDTNDDFTAWFDTMNQPDGGDYGGGHLSITPRGASLNDVPVDALAGVPVANIDVMIIPQMLVRTDRPVFSLPDPLPVVSQRAPVTTVRLSSVIASSDVLRQRGVFPVQWADVNRDGRADDLNGDGAPEVYPLVIAELLDPMDPANLTVAADRAVMFGYVAPGQFAARDFPSTDPTRTSSVILADRLDVIFAPIAVDPAQPTETFAAPAGRYRVTVINGSGQTWTVPNELSRATGDPVARSAAAYLTVGE